MFTYWAYEKPILHTFEGGPVAHEANKALSAVESLGRFMLTPAHQNQLRVTADASFSWSLKSGPPPSPEFEWLLAHFYQIASTDYSRRYGEGRPTFSQAFGVQRSGEGFGTQDWLRYPAPEGCSNTSNYVLAFGTRPLMFALGSFATEDYFLPEASKGNLRYLMPAAEGIVYRTDEWNFSRVEGERRTRPYTVLRAQFAHTD